MVMENLRFRTAGPGPFRFLVFGDSGTGTQTQFSLAQRMIESEDPSLVLHTGDLSQESGTLDQLEANYLQVYAQLMARAPFFPSPGNHDYYTDGANPAFALHAAPLSDVPQVDSGHYYSFDWGNVHFVSLNSNLAEFPDAFERMLTWLERDLGRQRNFWKVVYFHHPPYPTGHHLDDPVCAAMRDRVVPIVERHGVQLVLSGHEHSYQRTFPLRGGVPVEGPGGTTYMITGGGGGGLHAINQTPLMAASRSAHHYLRAEVRGARMTLDAVGIDGEILDTVTITAPAQPYVEAVVNAAASTSALAGGSLFSIFGRDLAVEERVPPPWLPAARELAGTSVTVNGESIPLLSVSPHHISAQLPYGLSGPVNLCVNTRTSSAETAIEVLPNAPAVLETPLGFRRFASIWKSDTWALVTPASPVRRGEQMTLHAVGLGAISGEIQAGQQAPDNPPLRASDPIRVLIGTSTLIPDFAGLVPGRVGLYQVTLRIPYDVPDGASALRIAVNGTVSEPVTLFIAPQ